MSFDESTSCPRLVGLAFSGSIGMTLVILGCALPGYGNWWPFFVTLFYVLSPIPTVLARRYQDDVGSSNACKELALFITTGIVISAFGLPLVLARSGGPVVSPISFSLTVVNTLTIYQQIHWGSCLLTLAGNVVVFLTILGFFLAFDNEDDAGYRLW